MKNLLVIILIGLFLGSYAFGQDKPTSQTPLANVQALQELNEEKVQQLESLEQLYNKLSAEIVLDDALIDAILDGASTRASCTASCPDGNSVTCTGDPCVAIDGIGCNAATADNGRDLKRCKKAIIITIE